MDAIHTIKAKLSTGKFPCEAPDRTWAGNGSGQPCSACDQPIPMSSFEHEWVFPNGRILRLHAQCAMLVHVECLRRPRAMAL